MLSLINISVPGRPSAAEGLPQAMRETVISNLQAVFSEGYVHGLFAPDAAPLKRLLECISGQRTAYAGNILYNDGPLAGQAAFIDCRHITAAAISGKALLPEPAGALSSATQFPEPSGYELPGSRLTPATDFSKDIILLHNLRSSMLSNACAGLPAFLQQLTTVERKIVIITSHDYHALRDTCDYIYLFDKKRFPIVVEKADFAQFDSYFENVFRLYRPHN